MFKCLFFLGLTFLLTTRIAWAILGIGDTAVVIDPSNLVQSTLTAARTATSNANELTQISNQIRSYVQEAKAFVALPMSIVDQMSGLYQQYNDVMMQGRYISWTLTNSVNQFESLYQSGFNGNVPMMQRAQQMINQVRDAGRAATAVSALYDRLCVQQAMTKQLVAASQASPGTLAAQQATNQLMSVLGDQQASLQQIAAASARIQTSFIMREVTSEERAQWNSHQFMAGFGDGTFRGCGQGQGFRLPE